MIIPNFIDLKEYQLSTVERKQHHLVFSGSFRYSANYDAMLWFLHKVYPLILKHVSDTQLLITGDHAGLPLPMTQNVHLTGHVQDIKSLIASCDVSIVPIWRGGGTRLKILEAMAVGTRVVSTSKGAEGLIGINGEHFLLADEPERFAEQVVRILQDREWGRQLASNAYRQVEENYDWAGMMPKFLHMIDEATVRKATDKAVWLDNEKVKVALLNPSFTNGGDRTVLYFGTVGKLAEPHGYKGLEYDEYLIFQEDVTDQSMTRSQQVVQWFRNECLARGVQPKNAGYDKSGAGGPLGDFISVAWSKDVYGLQFAGRASEKPVSAYDPTPSHDRYVNSVSEIWYSSKEYMRTGQRKGIGDDLMREMCMRKLDPNGEKNLALRIKVLPKSEMKQRFGHAALASCGAPTGVITFACSDTVITLPAGEDKRLRTSHCDDLVIDGLDRGIAFEMDPPCYEIPVPAAQCTGPLRADGTCTCPAIDGGDGFLVLRGARNAVRNLTVRHFYKGIHTAGRDNTVENVVFARICDDAIGTIDDGVGNLFAGLTIADGCDKCAQSFATPP